MCNCNKCSKLKKTEGLLYYCKFYEAFIDDRILSSEEECDGYEPIG